MARALRIAAACATGVLLLAACDTSPGVVTGREYRVNSFQWVLTIKHASGKTTHEYVYNDVGRKCHVGDRWPECAK